MIHDTSMTTRRQDFTTADLDASATRMAWRQYMGEVFFKLDIETNADAIVGSLAKTAFDQVHFSSLKASSQRVKRSKRLALDDNIESFCFIFPIAGSFTCRQRRDERKAEAGDMCIVNAAEAHQVDIADRSEMVCLTIPSDLLRPRIRGIDDMCAKGGVIDPVLASTMRHLAVQSLARTPEADALQMQSLCIDMIDIMIIREGGTNSGCRYSDAIAASLVSRLRSIMRLHFHEPDFDLSKAATACMVSTRQLQAALQKHGSTFSRDLLETRLSAAAHMLRSKVHLSRQIGFVAEACGFSSQAHFAYRFRERFGHTPSAERMLDRGPNCDTARDR